MAEARKLVGKYGSLRRPVSVSGRHSSSEEQKHRLTDNLILLKLSMMALSSQAEAEGSSWV